jgi:hypothetical protein
MTEGQKDRMRMTDRTRTICPQIFDLRGIKSQGYKTKKKNNQKLTVVF